MANRYEGDPDIRSVFEDERKGHGPKVFTSLFGLMMLGFLVLLVLMIVVPIIDASGFRPAPIKATMVSTYDLPPRCNVIEDGQAFPDVPQDLIPKTTDAFNQCKDNTGKRVWLSLDTAGANIYSVKPIQ